MMLQHLKRWMAALLAIAGVVSVMWAYPTWQAIRVVSANAEVFWAKGALSRLLQYCSPSGTTVGLPGEINIQTVPDDPQAFVRAVGRLPNTVREVTIAVGNDPMATLVLDKVIEMKGVSEVNAYGCEMTDESLMRLTGSPSLRTLSLSGNQQSFHAFSPVSRVESLEMDKTLLDLKGLNRVLGIRTLKVLSIVENALDYDALLKVNWNSASLEGVVLGYIGEVSPEQIQRLADTIKKGCPKISEIYVNQRNVIR